MKGEVQFSYHLKVGGVDSLALFGDIFTTLVKMG